MAGAGTMTEAAALAERLLAVPVDIRDEVAREIGSVAFAWGAGTCALRNVYAQGVIRARLGIEVPLVIGGMIYRAGPDRVRDVLAFCGPDNRMMRAPGGIMGHWWLEAGGLVLDFSPGDWPHEAAALAEAEARQTGERLGRIRFDSLPAVLRLVPAGWRRDAAAYRPRGAADRAGLLHPGACPAGRGPGDARRSSGGGGDARPWPGRGAMTRKTSREERPRVRGRDSGRKLMLGGAGLPVGGGTLWVV
jgi:hypothetical protein